MSLVGKRTFCPDTPIHPFLLPPGSTHTHKLFSPASRPSHRSKQESRDGYAPKKDMFLVCHSQAFTFFRTPLVSRSNREILT